MEWIIGIVILFIIGAIFGSNAESDDDKYDRIARERMDNIKSRALSRLGLDTNEIKEVSPIELSGYYFSRGNIKAWIGKDGKARSNFYKAVVIFFSRNEMHIYTNIFSLDDTTEMEGTDVYFYQDIVSVSTSPNNIHIEGKNKEDSLDIRTIEFRLVTKGGTSVTVDTFNNSDVERSVNAMRALLRERKERPMAVDNPQPFVPVAPVYNEQAKRSAPKTYEPILGIETGVLIKRAFLFLEDGEFDNAGRYIEQALNQNPENPRVYMAKLMLERKVSTPEELIQSLPTPLEDEKLYQRALRFADDEYKSQLENYAQASRDKLEQKRLLAEAELERIRLAKEAEKEELYQKIMLMKSTASTIEEFEEVLRLISSIRPYKDTKELYTEVSKALYTEKDYQRALETKKKAHELEDFRSLVYTLEQLNGYKDSELLLTEAREALNKAEQHERKKKVVKIIVVVILAIFAYFSYSKYSARLAQEQKQQELNQRRIAREEAQRREVQNKQPSRAEKAFRSARELELSEAYVQARQYYHQAVELGHPEAQKYLTALERKLAQNTEQGVKASIQGAYAQAESYLNDKNYSKAIEIFRRFANDGYAPAQDKLAWMYQNGWGVEQSYTQAVSWFRKAAEQGNTEALASMGLMYLKGWGVPQNYDTALEWYGKAASQGSEVAQRRINSIQLLKVNMQKLLASTEQGIGFPIAGTIFAEILSVRQSPNTSSKRVKTLKTGHPVSVSRAVDSDNDYWFYVKTASGTEGWVLAGYVNLIDRDLSYQETINKKHSLPASGYVTTREDSLNLRNIPTVKGSQVVEKLDSGTYFTAYEVFAGDTIDWYRIRTTEGDEG